MLGWHTPKHAFQALNCSLHLTVGLRVVSRRKTHCHPECSAERSPHLGCELWTSVRNKDSMQTEDMVNKEHSCPCCRWELGQRHEVNGLGETVHQSKYDCVPIGGGKTTTEKWQGVEQTCKWLVWRLSTNTHTGQAVINDFMSSVMEGHQKRCQRRCRVWARPGWQVRLYECPHCRTSEKADCRTNNLFWGLGTERCASRALSSTC